VPNLAKREHQKNLPLLLRRLKKKEPNLTKRTDLLAVTVGPGLEPALWTGINFAKDLAKEWKKPLIGVNHLQGHLYSFLLETTRDSRRAGALFPAAALIVSGGHTILLKMDSLTEYRKMGETRDDAAGEAFDKIARLLNLPYPGGPEIERAGRKGDPAAIVFPRPMLNAKNYDFSFAGLKTAVFYFLKQRGFVAGGVKKISNSRLEENVGNRQNQKFVSDVAAGFEQAVTDVLVKKTVRLAESIEARNVFLSGGVAANQKLRRTFEKELKKENIGFIAPSREFNTDNAAMIAVAAYIGRLREERKRIYARANLNL